MICNNRSSKIEFSESSNIVQSIKMANADMVPEKISKSLFNQLLNRYGSFLSSISSDKGESGQANQLVNGIVLLTSDAPHT